MYQNPVTMMNGKKVTWKDISLIVTILVTWTGIVSVYFENHYGSQTQQGIADKDRERIEQKVTMLEASILDMQRINPERLDERTENLENRLKRQAGRIEKQNELLNQLSHEINNLLRQVDRCCDSDD